MLIWNERLWLDPQLGDPDGIRRRLDHGRRVKGVYLITYAVCPSNLLDIVPVSVLGQKRAGKLLPPVVGIAQDKDRALRLACRIVLETYAETGSFRLQTKRSV